MQQADIDARIAATQERVDAKRRVEHGFRAQLYAQAREAVQFAMKHKLRFCHVRATARSIPGRPEIRNWIKAKGGATICYSKPMGSSIITFSLSQCSPKDVYCRATGRINSVDNWQNGNHISLLLPKHVKPSDFLKNYLFNYQ